MATKAAERARANFLFTKYYLEQVIANCWAVRSMGDAK